MFLCHLRSVLSTIVIKNIVLHYIVGRLALRRLRQVSSHLTAAQTSLLTSVLRHNARTSFGRRHRFSDAVARAATRDDVRRAYIACVPLTTHDDYVDDVQRLLQSKDAASAGILTADRVEFLSYSSGTTGRNKLVPVTRWSKVSDIVFTLRFIYTVSKNVIFLRATARSA